MYQSSKSLWPSSKGGPEVSKTPPTRKVWMIMSQVMTIPKNNVLRYLMICFVFGTNLSIKIIFGNFYFLLIAITQNIQTLQIGGVLETSGPPLDDGHRYFED